MRVAFYDPQADLSMRFNIDAKFVVMHCEMIATEAISYVASLDKDKIFILLDSKSALMRLTWLPSNIRVISIAYNILDTI